jgi:hypothetical protein
MDINNINVGEEHAPLLVLQQIRLHIAKLEANGLATASVILVKRSGDAVEDAKNIQDGFDLYAQAVLSGGDRVGLAVGIKSLKVGFGVCYSLFSSNIFSLFLSSSHFTRQPLRTNIHPSPSTQAPPSTARPQPRSMHQTAPSSSSSSPRALQSPTSTPSSPPSDPACPSPAATRQRTSSSSTA